MNFSASEMRLCDNELCRSCLLPVLSSQEGYRVTVPKKKLDKLTEQQKQQLQLKWDSNKESNYFHKDCYDTVTKGNSKSYKNRTIQKLELSAVKTVEDTIERFDTIDKVKDCVAKLAAAIRRSSYSFCFTGAGISAAAGIPTYRGAEGIDTLEAYGSNTNASTNHTEAVVVTVKELVTNQTDEQKKKDSSTRKSKKRKVEDDVASTELVDDDDDQVYLRLQPTVAHQVIAKMHKQNLLQFCITQNCDDLHRKSGIPCESLVELHGNVFCEFCEKCNKHYYRKYCVDAYSTCCSQEKWYKTCPQCKFGHYTGRKCNVKKCKGKLRDTIVNFGDDLHEHVLGGLPLAMDVSKRADLCLCLGSSLTVHPACYLPKNARTIVICNLQATECDNIATVRVWATCDMLMGLLAKELQLFTEV